MLFKSLTCILVLHLAIPPPPFAKNKVEDGAEVDIRACGNFQSCSGSGSRFGCGKCAVPTTAFETADGERRGLKPNSMYPKDYLDKSKNTKELIDTVMLEMIRQKVKEKLRAFCVDGSGQRFEIELTLPFENDERGKRKVSAG